MNKQANTIDTRSSIQASRPLRRLQEHWQAMVNALRHLRSNPASSVLTALAVGLCLSFPAILFLLLHNAEMVTARWQAGTQMTVFLSPHLPEVQAQAVVNHLSQNPKIESVKYISAEQGLEEFRQHTELDDVIANLPQNPLPAVIEIHPARSIQTPAQLAQLVTELRQFPEAARVSVDQVWVERLYQIIGFLKRTTFLLEGLTLLGVCFVLGAMIRLAISQHQQDLLVLRLVCATRAYMRRPFLYTGMFYSLAGGVIAAGIINFAIAQLNIPIRALARTYQSQFALATLDFSQILILLLACALIGWLSARLATIWGLRGLA